MMEMNAKEKLYCEQRLVDIMSRELGLDFSPAVTGVPKGLQNFERGGVMRG